MPTLGSRCYTNSKSEQDQRVPAARLSLILLWEFRTQSSSSLALLQFASTSTLAPERLHRMVFEFKVLNGVQLPPPLHLVYAL